MRLQCRLAKSDAQHKTTIITTNRMLRPIPTKLPQLSDGSSIKPIMHFRFGRVVLPHLIKCLASNHALVLPNEKS